MAGGLALTVVGMLTVFAFLIILVLSMSVLRLVALRLPDHTAKDGGLTTAAVAAAVAAIHARTAARSGAAQAKE